MVAEDTDQVRVLKKFTNDNLKDVDVRVPLGVFTVVTGVSGAGKSSLINGILLPALSLGKIWM